MTWPRIPVWFFHIFIYCTSVWGMLSKSVINGEYIHTRRVDGFGLKYMYVCVHYRVMHAQIGQDSSGAGLIPVPWMG